MNKRKYELITWYPSLPKKCKNRETIAKPHPSYTDRLSLYVEGSYKGAVSIKEVENNPKFWRRREGNQNDKLCNPVQYNDALESLKY